VADWSGGWIRHWGFREALELKGRAVPKRSEKEVKRADTSLSARTKNDNSQFINQIGFSEKHCHISHWY